MTHSVELFRPLRRALFYRTENTEYEHKVKETNRLDKNANMKIESGILKNSTKVASKKLSFLQKLSKVSQK